MDKKQFIIEHLCYADRFEIEDIYKAVYKRTWNAFRGVRIDEKGAMDSCTFKVNFDKSIEENVADFEAYLKARGSYTEEFTTYNEVSHVFRWYYFRRDEKNFTISPNGISSLIYFLRYLTTGEPDQDYAETNKFMDANKISHNSGKFEIDLNGLKVKKFLNGRVDIVGLSDAQQKKIDRFIEMSQTFR